MQADAEAHADEDKKKQELAEAKNIADTMVHTAEKALKDAEGKIGDDIKKEVTDAIVEVKKARDGDDKDVVSKASEALSTAMMKIGEAMKTANEAAQASSGQSSESSGTEEAPKTDTGTAPGAETK
jgi:molecular chaperone DnaK